MRMTSRWAVRLLVVLAVLSAAAAAFLGMRTVRTYALLVSAYEVGRPDLSNVRPWMTLRYVAAAYRVPEPELRAELAVPVASSPDTTLGDLARSADMPRPDYLLRVQRAIVAAAPGPAPPRGDDALSADSERSEDLVSAVLVYGYPALALALFLAALGVPLPSGLLLIVAGSLAAQGRMTGLLVVAFALSASVAGDLAGYGVGRSLGADFLERKGHWIGLSRERRASVERLFQRWGALSLLLSRSLVSVLSSAVNLIAGAGRYPILAFLAWGVVGRIAWASAYAGLGYVAASGLELEPAADFLRNLTGLLITLAICAGAAFAARRQPSVL